MERDPRPAAPRPARRGNRDADGTAALHRRDAELDARLELLHKRVGGLLIKDVGEMVV